MVIVAWAGANQRVNDHGISKIPILTLALSGKLLLLFIQKLFTSFQTFPYPPTLISQPFICVTLFYVILPMLSETLIPSLLLPPFIFLTLLPVILKILSGPLF